MNLVHDLSPYSPFTEAALHVRHGWERHHHGFLLFVENIDSTRSDERRHLRVPEHRYVCNHTSTYLLIFRLSSCMEPSVCREKEAASAHKSFHSYMGDHISLLSAFRAFLAVSELKRASWCRRNFISYKALRHADQIKQQLLV